LSWMKKYKQLILAQRNQIEVLLQVGITQTSIAMQLSVHKSTISRELKEVLLYETEQLGNI